MRGDTPPAFSERVDPQLGRSPLGEEGAGLRAEEGAIAPTRYPGVVDLDTFTKRAGEILDEVPEEFLRGIAGVEVHELPEPHPHVAGVWTLGMCADDELTRLASPDTMRSRVHLYHGSFVEVARRDPSFDWEAELRETILHEIRHDLEDRAGLPDLRNEDALEDALSRFVTGEELPPRWYRHGEAMERDVWRVGDDLFVELWLRDADLERIRGGIARLVVLGEPFEPEIPEDVEPGETLSFDGAGLDRPGGGYGALHLVLVRD
jgi:hypothetical protein